MLKGGKLSFIISIKEDPFKFKVQKLYYYSRIRAGQKKLPNNLIRAWIRKQIRKGRARTGMKFDLMPTIRNPFGPSIDRIDIDKGYTTDNYQVVIWAYNQAKAWYTDEDVTKICSLIV